MKYQHFSVEEREKIQKLRWRRVRIHFISQAPQAVLSPNTQIDSGFFIPHNPNRKF